MARTRAARHENGARYAMSDMNASVRVCGLSNVQQAMPCCMAARCGSSPTLSTCRTLVTTIRPIKEVLLRYVKGEDVWYSKGGQVGASRRFPARAVSK